MAEYNLTAEELLLVYVTYIAREENGNNITYFNKWFNNGGKDRLRDLFNSLKSKGVILKSYNTDNSKTALQTHPVHRQIADTPAAP